MMVSSHIETTPIAARDPAGPGLTGQNFCRVAANGFGDPYNAYAHSMAWFRDHLYVGTSRACLAYRGRQRSEDSPDCLAAVWPVKIPKGLWDIDLRAEIWRYHPPTNQWTRAFSSPLVEGVDGAQVPMSVCFRTLVTFQRPGESSEVLYAPTMSTYQTAAVMLASTDGESFHVATDEGLGFPDVYQPRGIRAFTPFKGRLFASPAVGKKGQRKSYNFGQSMIILASADPTGGEWHVACEPHFGDTNNLSVFEMAEFNGHLYAGTMNVNEGFQIWKTDAEGTPPYKWKKVIGHGAYRGRLNQGAISLRPFNGSLYVGSGIQDGGCDIANKVGPAAGEILRIHPDDSWDLLVGEPRITPEGLKVPLSGLGPGFGKCFAGYIWSMREHEGWLYVGTFDWFMSLKYSRHERWPEHIPIRSPEKIDRMVNRWGGFDLWRTRDGARWFPVTQNGFGNPYNYGARSMASTPHGLYVGATNPFAPEVAIRRSAGWSYEHNPSGGLEVWQGSRSPVIETNSTSNAQGPVAPVRVALLTNGTASGNDEYLKKVLGHFYGGTGFRHFGCWRDGIKDARTACENLMDEILAFVPEKCGTVVEIDCGLGATTEYLSKHFHGDAITAVAKAKRDWRACQKAFPNLRFLYRRLPKLKLPSESFDVAIWAKRLHSTPTNRKTLRDVFRALKPGGRLVCFDVLRAVAGTSRVLFRERPVETVDEYRERLHAVGFRSIRLADVTAPCLNGFRKHRAEYIAMKGLSGEMEADVLRKLDGHLLKVEDAVRQCLLVTACKPENQNAGLD